MTLLSLLRIIRDFRNGAELLSVSLAGPKVRSVPRHAIMAMICLSGNKSWSLLMIWLSWMATLPTLGTFCWISCRTSWQSARLGLGPRLPSMRLRVDVSGDSETGALSWDRGNTGRFRIFANWLARTCWFTSTCSELVKPCNSRRVCQLNGHECLELIKTLATDRANFLG